MPGPGPTSRSLPVQPQSCLPPTPRMVHRESSLTVLALPRYEKCWLWAGVLLFLARKGVSVDCEVCQGVRNSCQGPIVPCPKIFDTCAIVLMGGKKGFNGIDKVCTHTEACRQRLTRINVGRDIAVWNVIACCKGLECKRTTLILPEVRTNLNGLQCPASLVTKQQEFKEEKIGCGGDEIYCFELTGNATTQRGFTSEITMKGCTTQDVCNSLNVGLVAIVPLGVVGRGKCKLAGLAPSIIPALSGLFLQHLTILLLLKGLL